MKRDILGVVTIGVVVIVFFARLFSPEPQLIVTPDFGRSDAWHFSFATKFALAQSLKREELPLWEPRMGMGLPLVAEGQVGALFLPNLVLFTVIQNPVVAYNATYVALFLIVGWGMYGWLRVIGCSRLASLFGAVTVVFSGQTIPRLPHHTLLESLSMTPLVLALGHVVLTKTSGIWISIFAIALSQQLFTGSPQPVLLALLMIGIYTIASRGSIGRLAIGILLGIGLAAIQIVPSAEMLRESTSPGGFSPDEASYYSFPLVHLKTLVSPFALGNPKLGTYPPFTAFDGSIFWENNLFIGWLPIVLLVFGLRKWSAATLLLSFLLMLGKHSPLYLLYSVWPLNLMRVPSRFAWVFLLVMVTAASWAMTRVTAGKTWVRMLAAMLIAVHGYQLMTTWWNYHAIKPARDWLTATPFMERIKDANGPIRTIGAEATHNAWFLTEGWRGNLDRYQFLTNALAPNSNLYWDIRQTDVYAGRFLKRPSLVESLLGSEIKLSESVATISAQGKRLLDMYHAEVIVSSLPLDMETPLAAWAATTSAGIPITAYRNPDALPRAYLTTQTVVAPTLTKAAEALAHPSFIPGNSVLVHDESRTLQRDIKPRRKDLFDSHSSPPQAAGYSGKVRDESHRINEKGGGSVAITNERPSRVVMRANVTAETAILVFGDTYYPGWQATVDGQPAEIFPVNIKERGIRLTKGAHTIVWEYHPKSVQLGAWISLLSAALIVGYLVWHAGIRTHRAVPAPSPHFSHSRDR